MEESEQTNQSLIEAQEKLRQTYAQAVESLKEWNARAMDAARQNPKAVILISAAAGFLAGLIPSLLIRRRT